MDDALVVAKLEQAWRAHVVGDPHAQLEQYRKREADQEHRLSIPTPTSQYLTLRVCARYGLHPYRSARTRRSTFCLKAPPGFVREVLGPMVESMASVVEAAVHEMSTWLIDGWYHGNDQTSA
jgi:hypothetical protein